MLKHSMSEIHVQGNNRSSEVLKKCLKCFKMLTRDKQFVTNTRGTDRSKCSSSFI